MVTISHINGDTQKVTKGAFESIFKPLGYKIIDKKLESINEELKSEPKSEEDEKEELKSEPKSEEDEQDTTDKSEKNNKRK